VKLAGPRTVLGNILTIVGTAQRGDVFGQVHAGEDQ
jgi:hypothetical protein